MTGHWNWNGYNIRYQRCGEKGPPVLLIHGFGGNWYCRDKILSAVKLPVHCFLNSNWIPNDVSPSKGLDRQTGMVIEFR